MTPPDTRTQHQPFPYRKLGYLALKVTDLERFDEHAPREARMLKPGLETVDEWGGAPSPGYAQQSVVEGAA